MAAPPERVARPSSSTIAGSARSVDVEAARSEAATIGRGASDGDATNAGGPALSNEGAVQRFLRATEIDTRMLGMIAALLIIWVGFDVYSGILGQVAAGCSAARS